MDLSDISFDAIKPEHIERLVADGTPEGRKYIEYKVKPPGTSDKDKSEFLADISSFANTAGGDIVYGIAEQGGIPRSADGIEVADLDEVMTRLENIMRDGVRPRLIGARCQSIKLSNSKVFIHIRVPKSWAPPHMVLLDKRIYGRSSTGKHPLDVDEIRPLFAASALTADKVDMFRFNRLLKIKSGELPVQLPQLPTLVIHTIPLGAFSEALSIDLSAIYEDDALQRLASFGGSFRTYSFDGALFVRYSQHTFARKSLLVFRNGICESIDTVVADESSISGLGLELIILKSITRMLKIQRSLGVGLPALVAVSLVNVLKVGIQGPRNTPGGFRTMPIDRYELIVPNVVIERPDMRLDAVMRSSFDLIWSAAGWPGTMSYENGEWRCWNDKQAEIEDENDDNSAIW